MSLHAVTISPATVQRAICHRAGDLLIQVPFVTPEQTNQEIFSIFENAPQLSGLPVIEDEHPIGLINRNTFMQSLARPFCREIYRNKSCIAFMDKAPLIVDSQLDIQTLSFQALSHGENVLTDGYILTDQGRYIGMGTGHGIVKAIADLQAEKNRQVMESIDYASVIQKSLGRSSREALRRHLPNHFLLWEPRDIVSGDYFYFHVYEGGFFAALFDCTGHGVPGAFMTMIMSSFLQNALITGDWRDPASIMALVNVRVKTALGQIDHSHAEPEEATEGISNDGMDAAFCAFDETTRTLTYAGAHAPLFLLAPEANELQTIEGNRTGIGYADTPIDQRWDNHQVNLAAGTACYFFTDGVFDQLGGERRIAFGKKRLSQVILKHRHETMPEQRAAILENLLAYQGNERRKDDVSGLGFVL